jgi:cell division inhibitor SulA
MQYPYPSGRAQLPLFHGAIIASSVIPLCEPSTQVPAHCADRFSELTLSGSVDNCLNLLAPVLRQLSMQQDQRWLSLIGAPPSLTQAWLRKAGLQRERILLLQAESPGAAHKLACQALQLGRSHTVVSWINRLDDGLRNQLAGCALKGHAQSLNIRLE